ENQGETSTKFINLIERITYQKWHISITITIQDSFKIQTTALIDSEAQMNCIQEGLIPTKYFEKTKQRLSTTNGENLRVKFKISDIHICNEGICIKQSFILVKDLNIGIILGQPFLEVICTVRDFHLKCNIVFQCNLRFELMRTMIFLFCALKSCKRCREVSVV
ncbi:hypothetical protein CFOL_v3_33251, partial [Cephalotus follicularis]